MSGRPFAPIAALRALSIALSLLGVMVVTEPSAAAQQGDEASAQTPDASTQADDPNASQPKVPDPPGASADPNKPPPMRALVLITATTGIDPVVGQHITTQIKSSLTNMGYEVLSDAIVADAVARTQMVYPPAPADLWRATHGAQAHRGVFARAWAENGKYVTEIVVASADGAGPFFARGSFTADTLLSGVDGLVQQAVPALGVWQITNQQNAVGLPTTDPNAAVSAPPQSQREPIRPEPPIKNRLRVALQTEGAFGVGDEFFYNHLVGLKVDVKVGRTILLGAYLAYANLQGANSRVGNILPMALVENRIRIGRPAIFTIPLRIQGGYLPKNGPVFRFSGGLNFELTERIELGIDLISPTFWVLPERTAFSFNLGAELGYRF